MYINIHNDLNLENSLRQLMKVYERWVSDLIFSAVNFNSELLVSSTKILIFLFQRLYTTNFG